MRLPLQHQPAVPHSTAAPALHTPHAHRFAYIPLLLWLPFLTCNTAAAAAAATLPARQPPRHVFLPQAAAAAAAEPLADEDDELRERLNAMRTT